MFMKRKNNNVFEKSGRVSLRERMLEPGGRTTCEYTEMLWCFEEIRLLKAEGG